MMPPLYSGSADEWSYLSTGTTGSAMKVEFIIDKFENQMKRMVTPLKSHQFTVQDTLWHIEVVPDCLVTVDADEEENESEDEGEEGYVGVFIINDNKADLAVECKIVIGDVEVNVEDLIPASGTVGSYKFGCPRLLTHQKCKDILNEGKLIVTVEINVLEEATLIQGKGKNFNVIPESSNVNLKIFEDQDFTDFRVVCVEKSIPCHKAFLVARSSVFKTMMESDMKEAKEATVELESCFETVALSFVKFFYTGHVDYDILKENAIKFLDLGEKYDLARLKAITEQAMIGNLDKENMLSFFLAGDFYHGDEIRAAAKTFLRQNKKSLMEQKGWKEALSNRDLVFELMESF